MGQQTITSAPAWWRSGFRADRTVQPCDCTEHYPIHVEAPLQSLLPSVGGSNAFAHGWALHTRRRSRHRIGTFDGAPDTVGGRRRKIIGVESAQIVDLPAQIGNITGYWLSGKRGRPNGPTRGERLR